MPFERAVIESYASRADWDAAATDLVRTMLERWHLTAGEAYVGGEAGAALRVTTADGSPAVLKVGFPHVEAVDEAVVLDVWSASGLSPKVLSQDAWTWSMLLEEVRPGTALSLAPEDGALDAGVRLLSRLHACEAPASIPTLPSTMRAYLDEARSLRPGQEKDLRELGATELLDTGLDECERLAADSVGDALLHGDFNPGNVLRAGQDSWLAIDPKPMTGDPAFDLYPLVQQLGDPHTAAARLESAIALLGCDLSRAFRWSFARSALNVSWYVADGDREAARAAAAEAAAWRELSAP